MSEIKKSKSKKPKAKSGAKSKSKGQLAGRAQKAQELRMMMTSLVVETRLIKQQRSMLPKLLRAKVETSEATLLAQAKRMAAVNIAMAEALRSALAFKGLKADELGTVGKLIISLVKTAAERYPQLVTPAARHTAEALLGETLEEFFLEEAKDFLTDPESAHMMELAQMADATHDLQNARSVYELNRMGAVIQRRIHPVCVGDLEYFVKLINHDPEYLESATAAVRLVEGLLAEASKAQPQGSNVISFNAAAGVMNLGSLADSRDVLGCLDVLLSHPEFGSCENILDKLGSDQQTCLLKGLAAQHEMLDFELTAILSHPDLDELGEFAGELSDMIHFEPLTMLQAMSEREVLFTNLAADIVHNKSIRAVRALIRDFEEATSVDDDKDDDWGNTFSSEYDVDSDDFGFDDGRGWV